MHVLCSTPSLAEVLDPERWLLFSPLLQLVLLFPFITNQNSANPVVLKIRSDVCAKLERERVCVCGWVGGCQLEGRPQMISTVFYKCNSKVYLLSDRDQARHIIYTISSQKPCASTLVLEFNIDLILIN